MPGVDGLGIDIACWPMHATDADTLLSYMVKTIPMQRYDPGLDSGSLRTLSLLTELRRSADKGELRWFLRWSLR
jgi:hypothetical protein